jgi:hypothetical protein
MTDEEAGVEVGCAGRITSTSNQASRLP